VIRAVRPNRPPKEIDEKPFLVGSKLVLVCTPILRHGK
jgi:hypothetical protein